MNQTAVILTEDQEYVNQLVNKSQQTMEKMVEVMLENQKQMTTLMTQMTIGNRNKKTNTNQGDDGGGSKKPKCTKVG